MNKILYCPILEGYFICAPIAACGKTAIQFRGHVRNTRIYEAYLHSA